MIFQRVRSEGLAHISYVIGSGNEVAVIDPRRDCQTYVNFSKREAARIKYIFETHRNEDYVIGSIELANLSGAGIYHGSGLRFGYGRRLRDGQEFAIGTLKLVAIRTPGHTDEGMSYAVADLEAGEEPIMVFTGDTLFVGDVGRVDLYGPEEAPRMAENLYDSIFKRILPLGDGMILCPAHSSGSVCGGAISEREESTLGLERAQNPALQKGRRDFIRFKVAERHERPPYFRMMEKYNLEGPPLLGRLPDPDPLSPREFRKRMEAGALVVDTRKPAAFGGAHIKGLYSIWLEGLPSQAGWMLPYDRPILLVLEERAYLGRAVRYLVRLGYDRIGGYLCGGDSCGIEAWYDEALKAEHLGLLTVQELRARMEGGGKLVVLDVRRDDEWEGGHIAGAIHIPLGHLGERLKEVPRNLPIAVVCNVGNRASIGASILRREGYGEVYNVLGSMIAWRNAAYQIVK